MKTWKQYKQHVKDISDTDKEDMEYIESTSSIISSVISQRMETGLSQRSLAEICQIPQSTLARIESYKTIPNLETLLKIMRPLGLTLTVSAINSNADM